LSYFLFLFLFVILPALAVLAVLRFRLTKLEIILIGIHALVALIYTTPWDNYLVANRIWWYDPDLVTGIVFGWVPIEEYTFFIVQPVLSGAWLVLLMRRIKTAPAKVRRSRAIRLGSVLAVGLIWIGSVAILASGWAPGTYLGLELAWALPPIMLQLGFGADLLWARRKLVGLALASATLYLSAADALAITAGTWEINPEKTINLLLGGVLPLEEFMFFLLTNTLIVFGITLGLAPESIKRIPQRIGARLLHDLPKI